MKRNVSQKKPAAIKRRLRSNRRKSSPSSRVHHQQEQQEDSDSSGNNAPGTTEIDSVQSAPKQNTPNEPIASTSRQCENVSSQIPPSQCSSLFDLLSQSFTLK